VLPGKSTEAPVSFQDWNDEFQLRKNRHVQEVLNRGRYSSQIRHLAFEPSALSLTMIVAIVTVTLLTVLCFDTPSNCNILRFTNTPFT
jgi:hypothetical protein